MLDKWISKHEVAANKYSNQLYFMLFIDWKSAFDRVDHDLLMSRLRAIGVTEQTLLVVHIFLYSSNFSIDGLKRHKIEKGCPQGSSLSPLLFIIFFGTLIERLRSIIHRE
jgi:retron-type reverse transcriptase